MSKISNTELAKSKKSRIKICDSRCKYNGRTELDDKSKVDNNEINSNKIEDNKVAKEKSH